MDGAETRHFGKWIRNTLKVFKCGAGEGWISVGLIVEEMKYYEVSRRGGISFKQVKKIWIGLILHWNWLLKQAIEGTILVENEGKMRKKT